MRGDARRQSCNTAIASFARAVEQGVGHQSQDCHEVAQAFDGGGFEDQTEGAALNRSHRSGGGNDRGISTAHAAATGRLPLCSSAITSASDAVGATSVPSAAWHLSLARCREPLL
jgi:hypothetical protein